MSIKNTLSEKVYQELKKDIIKGKYKQGSELTEIFLAESYKVSRTPVREALRRLEKETIVRLIPHKGALVSEPSIKDTIEINELRELLEGFAARLAARWGNAEDFQLLKSKFQSSICSVYDIECIDTYNLGKELHDLILRQSRNDKLIALIDNIKDQADIIMQINAEIPGRYNEAYNEHLEIIDAIILRDEQLAENAMRKHIKNVSLSMIEYYGRGF